MCVLGFASKTLRENNFDIDENSQCYLETSCWCLHTSIIGQKQASSQRSMRSTLLKMVRSYAFPQHSPTRQCSQGHSAGCAWCFTTAGELTYRYFTAYFTEKKLFIRHWGDSSNYEMLVVHAGSPEFIHHSAPTEKLGLTEDRWYLSTKAEKEEGSLGLTD